MKKMGPIQSQEPTLRPVLTGKLVDSLDILMLHMIALLEQVEKEAEDNPFIEYDEQEGKAEREEKNDFMAEELEKWLDVGSVDVSKYVSKDLSGDFIEPPDTKETLQDYLVREISVALQDERQLEMAKQIIYSLDERGWLKESPEEIAKRMGIDKKKVVEVLEKVKDLEPVGVAAADLRESLLIQLEKKGEKGSLAYRILKKAYEKFLSLNKTGLAKEFAVSIEDVEDALRKVYKLDPQPGRHYIGLPQYVSPDAVIERNSTKGGEDYLVYLPDLNVPHIHLSSTYRRLLEKPETFSSEEKHYLAEKLQRAKNLLSAIQQRKETIRIIAEYIKDKEKDFFSGEKPPELITEEEVAQNIGVNVSTVSRAIKDKWLETPRGMFRFSYFFSQGRRAEYHWILLLIEDMIKNEDKRHPLSDASISKKLKEKGFDIARTTVVKYRNMLGISSSSRRRMSTSK